KSESTITVDKPELIKNKRVLVVEDGPTLTHGEMKIGAGIIAAERIGGKEIVNPEPYTVGSLTDTFEKYPHIDTVLPAMGYGEQQLNDIEEQINNADCDIIIISTLIDLPIIINIEKPTTRVYYDMDEVGPPNLETVLADFTQQFELTKKAIIKRD